MTGNQQELKASSRNRAKGRRILCVTSNLPRWEGDSTTPFVLNLAQDLQALGWTVDILAPHAPNSATSETLADVQIKRFRYLPEPQETVCYQGGALINLRKHPLNYFKLPLLILAEWRAIQRQLKNVDYDLIHSHWILPQGFVGNIAARKANLPHVVTVHGGDVFGLRGPLMNWFKARTLRRASAVTANSYFTESAIREVAPELARVERIPMGVSVGELEVEQQREAEQLRAEYRVDNGPLVVFVGRIVDEKGVEDLLHALALLRADLPDLRCLIVGDGQDRGSMQALSSELDLDEVVTFTGWVEQESVRAHFAAADMAVAPSRTATDGWIEAQGLTILEAMMSKATVVATRLGGVTDSVLHEQTGLLVDERAPAQLAAAIKRLHLEPKLARHLANTAMERAEERFSRQTSARAFSALFEDLIAAT